MSTTLNEKAGEAAQPPATGDLATQEPNPPVHGVRTTSEAPLEVAKKKREYKEPGHDEQEKPSRTSHPAILGEWIILTPNPRCEGGHEHRTLPSLLPFLVQLG